MTMHLAELNVARALYDSDDPRIAGFTDNIDMVNAIADRSPGFVWRLQDESGAATDIPWSDDPRMLVNMSVWETPEDLEHFVRNTVHKKIYEQKDDWFPQMEMAHFVMWRVPAGHIPTLDEARARLDLLNKQGPTDDAFGWESLPNLTRWMNSRCA